MHEELQEVGLVYCSGVHQTSFVLHLWLVCSGGLCPLRVQAALLSHLPPKRTCLLLLQGLLTT
jgi:hypothetical protein